MFIKLKVRCLKMAVIVIKIMLQKQETVNSCSATGDIILLRCYHLIFNGNCGEKTVTMTLHWSFSSITSHYPHVIIDIS